MALDRWIALVILLICLVYGYTAFFTMDGVLPPFMQRNPVWPSTFPKILAVLGIGLSLCIVLGLEKDTSSSTEIDYRSLFKYKIGQAAAMILLMLVYALLLRPAGFLLSTMGFLVMGPVVLGERRLMMVLLVAMVAAGVVWYLVQEVLGIFLRPLPFFLG